MFEHKQQEIIHELPSGLAALIGLGRTSGIAVDVGTDLVQCQIFFEGYDIQQAVFDQPGSFKPQGNADFELFDGAIVPTMDLIRECKSSLSPGPRADLQVEPGCFGCFQVQPGGCNHGSNTRDQPKDPYRPRATSSRPVLRPERGSASLAQQLGIGKPEGRIGTRTRVHCILRRTDMESTTYQKYRGATDSPNRITKNRARIEPGLGIQRAHTP